MLIILIIGLTGTAGECSLYMKAGMDRLYMPDANSLQDMSLDPRVRPGFTPACGLGAAYDYGTTFHQAISDCESKIYETISSDWQSEPLSFFMRGIEIVSYPPLDILSPIGLYLYDKKDVARTGLTGFIGDCATVISLKLLINRSRPVEETSRINSSFPSGHTAFVFTQAVVYSHHNTQLRIPLYLYATVVGFSRVYLKKHFPTDVLGGAALGVLVGILAVKIFD
jgi:hypothetical protein